MTVLDEPVWEVRQPHPGRSGMSRFDGRTRSVLTAAAVTAIAVNAVVAWAYWKVTETDESAARPGTAVELTLRARSDFDRPLAAGETGKLVVTVTNDQDFPVRITAVKPAAGGVVADDEHRDAGCREPEVTMSATSFEVKWDVPRNTVGAFTVPDGLTMATGGGEGCGGATFMVPVAVSGYCQAG